MKILHVCSNYFPAHGGPQYTMKHLSEKMVAWHGDEVTVATSNSMYGPEQVVFKKINQQVEIINDVLVKRFPIIRWHYKWIDFATRISRRIVKKALPHWLRKYRWEMHSPGVSLEMKNTNAEVIMATTISYLFSDYPFWRFKTGNPKPFVMYGALHLHINWDKNSPTIKRARACDCYIANTEYERQKLIGFNVDEKKIVTIGTGIEIKDMHCSESDVAKFRKQHGIADDDILIGHIGRLSQGKGTGILLDAFIELYKKKKNIKLLLAGTSTGYEEALVSKIKEHNVPVILLDNFNDSLKPVLFNALDIFVLASKGESFGVVFLEAWACSKPVIGANTGAVSTLLSDGIDSYLFEPDNSNSLSQKISLLIDSKDAREAFGKNGFKKIIEHYTWPVIVSKYRTAYQIGIQNFMACSNKMS